MHQDYTQSTTKGFYGMKENNGEGSGIRGYAMKCKGFEQQLQYKDNEEVESIVP